MPSETASGNQNDLLNKHPEQYFSYGTKTSFYGVDRPTGTDIADLDLKLVARFVHTSRLRAFVSIMESVNFPDRDTVHRTIFGDDSELVLDTDKMSLEKLNDIPDPKGRTGAYNIHLKDQTVDPNRLQDLSRSLKPGLVEILKQEKLRFLPRFRRYEYYPGHHQVTLVPPSVNILDYIRGRVFLFHHGNHFIIPKQENNDQPGRFTMLTP